MIALAEYMDDFLSKDDDIKSVFHSFRYCCSLAGISQFQVFVHGKTYENQVTFEESLRIIIFKFNIWEIHLGLPQESWTIDSDVKADLMEKTSEVFSRRLQQFESPKVVEIKR